MKVKRPKLKLVISGNSRYVHHMFKHLKSEHPSTRKRMKLITDRRKK